MLSHLCLCHLVVDLGYLLLLDANRTESFTKSAEVYNKMAQAEVAKHSNFINNFVPDQIEAYKE